jgi:GntR family transcriptional repressor for pyruvate dehydrogenase complex
MDDHLSMAAPDKSLSSEDIMNRLSGELVPLQSEGLTEQLVRQIKAWALRGLVKPGERLPPERELASALRVSRSALRQALQVLQMMGVLEARQGSGNYLSQSADRILREPIDLLIPLRGVSFAELFEARRSMETEAAAFAALRGSLSDMEKLGHELDQMGSALDRPEVYFRHDVAFHRSIAHASRNSVFVWFFEMVSKVLSEAWLAKAHQGHTARTFAEHKAIFEAIARRDQDEARKAVLAHLSLDKFYSSQPTQVELRVTARKNGD